MNATVISMQKSGHLQQTNTGVVVHVDQTDKILVQCDKGVITATKAFSCMIRPMVNDTVLLAFTSQDSFVIAIIAREARCATLEFNGDVDLTTKDGRFSISAAQEIMLSSAGAIQQVSESNRIVSATLGLQVGAMSLNAETIQSNAKQSVINSDHITVTGINFYQQVEQVVRWVSKLETVNINNWIQNIRNTLSSRAKNAVITAQSDMKIDAERIHMG